MRASQHASRCCELSRCHHPLMQMLVSFILAPRIDRALIFHYDRNDTMCHFVIDERELRNRARIRPGARSNARNACPSFAISLATLLYPFWQQDISTGTKHVQLMSRSRCVCRLGRSKETSTTALTIMNVTRRASPFASRPRA